MKTEISIGAFSGKGIKAENEDSYGVSFAENAQSLTKGISIALADGMSGSAAGKEGSETCVKSLMIDYFATPDSWSVKKSVGTILRATNSWMHAQGQTVHDSDLGMVSTLSAMIVRSGVAHIFHVGDSRINLVRADSSEQLTTDHRQGRGRYLTRAMGAGRHLEIDYQDVELFTGDIFVMTSDGVHDFVDTPCIQQLIARNGEDLDRAASLVCRRALDNGSDDNLTCQIIRIDKLPDLRDERHFIAPQPLPFPPDLEPGMSIDGYEIIRELNASARSQVYLARDTGSGDLAVLKTPSVNFNDDARYIEMFHREQWVGARINSPHAMKVMPVRPDRRFLYNGCEYIDGQTLRQWINDHPEPEIAKVRDILKQLVQGVRALHRLDMLHRDLKPENIMIDSAGTVKIIDFGSVKIASIDEARRAALDILPAGAVDYTAPEYLTKGAGDNRADLYSLGVILYEILTCKLPYGRGFSNLRHVQRLEYIPATDVNSGLPPWIDGVLKKAVHKDPEARYQALSELERDFTTPPIIGDDGGFKPLLQMNPLLFWRALSFLLGVLLALSVFYE